MADASIEVDMTGNLAANAKKAADGLDKLSASGNKVRGSMSKAAAAIRAITAATKKVTTAVLRRQFEALAAPKVTTGLRKNAAAMRAISAATKQVTAANLKKQFEALAAPKVPKTVSVVDKLLGKLKGFAVFDISGILSGIASGLFAIAQAAGQAVLSFAKLVISSASFLQNSTVAFKSLTKSSKLGAEALQFVRDASVRFGLSVKNTAKQMTKLLAAQFTLGEAKDIIKLAADMKALGASADETASIIRTLGQVQARGRLQAGDLAALAEIGLSTKLVVDALSESLGKTTDEVQKLISSGKITAKQGTEAIKSAVKQKLGIEKLGDAGDKAGKTLSGVFDRFTAAANEAFLKIGEKLLPAIEKNILPVIEKIFAALTSPEASETIESIGAALSKVVAIVGVFFDTLVDRVKAFVKAFQEARGEAGGLGDALEDLDPEDLRKLLEPLEAIASAFGTLLGTIFSLRATIIGFVDGVKSAFAGIADFFSGLGDSVGGEMTAGLAAGILASPGAVIDALSSVIDAAIAAAKAKLKLGSPSKVFADIGTNVAAGLEEGIAGGAPRVSAATAGVVDPNAIAALGPGGGITNLSAKSDATINVQGAGDPSDVAVRVKDILLDEMAGAFEQLNIEVSG